MERQDPEYKRRDWPLKEEGYYYCAIFVKVVVAAWALCLEGPHISFNALLLP